MTAYKVLVDPDWMEYGAGLRGDKGSAGRPYHPRPRVGPRREVMEKELRSGEVLAATKRKKRRESKKEMFKEESRCGATIAAAKFVEHGVVEVGRQCIP